MYENPVEEKFYQVKVSRADICRAHISRKPSAATHKPHISRGNPSAAHQPQTISRTSAEANRQPQTSQPTDARYHV
jgi:hypothetical protein